jgi:hypothetical protein
MAAAHLTPFTPPERIPGAQPHERGISPRRSQCELGASSRCTRQRRPSRRGCAAAPTTLLRLCGMLKLVLLNRKAVSFGRLRGAQGRARDRRAPGR